MTAGDIVSMSVNDRVNGSGWLVFVLGLNISRVKCVLNVCVIYINVNVCEW